MNLYNLLSTIKDLSAFEMVNSAFIGDVYEVNARQDVEYPICVLTEGTHIGNTEEDTEIYSISLFLIDRLTEDKSNELDIKSWANEGVKDIISRIEETNVGLVQNGWQVNTFTQRFESLCAGAYATIQIETSGDECCGDTIKMVTSINGKTGDVVIDIPTVPTDISAFNNDAGYLTEHQDISNLATKDELNQKADKSEIPDVSIFNPTNNFKTINGQGIIGNGNIHIEGGAVTSVNGQTGDVVIDIPTVPTDISAFNNDAGYITDASLTDYARKDETVDINTYNQTLASQISMDEGQNDAISGLENDKADKNSVVSIDSFNTYKKEVLDEFGDVDNHLNNLDSTVANKADKSEIPDVSIFNPTNNFKTINGNSIIGTGDIQVQGGGGDVYANSDNIFTGLNTFQAEVIFENTEYDIPKTDISYGIAANFKTSVTQSSVLYTGLINYPKSNIDIVTTTGTYEIIENKIKLGTDGTSVTPLGIYENGELLSNKYAQLSNIPTIPENVSAFNNDAGYLTQHQDLSNYATKTDVTTTVDNKIDNLKIVWSGTQAAYDALADKTEYMVYLITKE